MSALLQDLRYGVRLLAKSPGFALAIILTLALGIGANTAIFTLINSLLLHPSGIGHPDRVAAIRVHYYKLNLKSISVSAPDFALVRDSYSVFASAAMSDSVDFNFAENGFPVRLRGSRVSSQWFDVFEVKPLLGRVFTPEENQPGAEHEAVLSYSAWREYFGGDPSAVGSTALFNGLPYKIVGVMPGAFDWPPSTDVWAPLALPASAYAPDNFFNESYFGVARTQPGVSIAQALAYTGVLSQRVIADPRMKGFPGSAGWGIFSVPITTFLYGSLRAPLLILFGAVALVLLIACANVAGLSLVRASVRAREFAVRSALGASRWRLARQMLGESFLLSLGGTALGLLIASGAIRGLLLFAPGNLSGSLSVSLDFRVLLFTAAVGTLAALIFGAAPAWYISSLDPQNNLRDARGSLAAGRTRHLFRNFLVASQLALALVLLAGTGVFLRSLSNLQEVNVGFRPHGLMTGALELPQTSYATPAKQIEFFRTVLDRLSASPGVISAAAASPLPFSGFDGSGSFHIEGRPELPGDPGPHAEDRVVTPAYFATMGIPILRGRAFTAEDSADSQAVAIIDTTLARLYWPGQDPVGRHIRHGNDEPWATIVGVVGAVRHSQVVGMEANVGGDVTFDKGVYYSPMFHDGAGAAFLVARGRGDAASLAPALREAVRSVDSSQPVSDLRTMDERILVSLGPRRSAVALLTVFAGIALLLAAIGLFGLVRFGVAQRTQEIGVRMTLGAQRKDIFFMVIGEAARLALAGIAAGLALAFVFTRVLRSLLYHVSPTDPLTFAGVAILLAGVALLACYLPARRATRIDPMVALRYE
ncbi:MAG TPA: ABC transporter permease [Verrucomicrobiae bacterium]|nr:ABC transporter permease [Verrucomicrobiae bacterium]